MELDSCVNLATRRRQRQPGLTVLSPVTVRACWEMGTKLKGVWKYFFHLHDLVHLTSHLCSLSNRRLSSTCTFVKRSPDPKQGQCQITAVVWHGCPLARVGVASEGINSEPRAYTMHYKTPAFFSRHLVCPWRVTSEHVVVPRNLPAQELITFLPKQS